MSQLKYQNHQHDISTLATIYSCIIALTDESLLAQTSQQHRLQKSAFFKFVVVWKCTHIKPLN